MIILGTGNGQDIVTVLLFAASCLFFIWIYPPLKTSIFSLFTKV